MECPNCELIARQFFCASCVKNYIHDFRRQTQHFASDRDDQMAKARESLESIVEPARLRRAHVSEAQAKVEEIQVALARLRKDNERKKEKLRVLREDVAARRQTLSAARLMIPNTQNPEHTQMASSLRSLATTITHARQGLIQELVEVFNIVQVGGRPPIGGKAGTKGEWTIGDLILPVPGDMRRYPPDHINTVITHTVHFIGLLTFYLGVKVPFEIVWSAAQPPPPSVSSPNIPPGKLGVGHPWIGATRGVGTEYGGWARWTVKHPLHLIQTSTSTSSSYTPPIPNPEDSILLPPDNSSNNPNFPTALTMLLYNVCYLGFTQNVDIPLSQAGDILSNLWSICCSSDLGRLSHATTLGIPPLPPPTPSNFQLDFAQLLQATTVSPRAAVSRARSVSEANRRAREADNRAKQSKILEEDEGWDLMEDRYNP